MKGVIVKKFNGAGNWYIRGDDGVEYFLGYKQCVNKEKYFKEGASVTFDVKDTGGKRLEAWNCVAEEPPKPTITNGDRIRSFSNEKLAICFASANGIIDKESIKEWKEWLDQEANDENLM